MLAKVRHHKIAKYTITESKGDEISSEYHNFPKFSDRQVWANSSDPEEQSDQGLHFCNSLCIFWTNYYKETPSCSTFRVITTNSLGVRIFRKFTVAVNLTD